MNISPRPNQNGSAPGGSTLSPSRSARSSDQQAGGGECPQCHGNGYIQLTAESMTECKECEGSGRVVITQRHVWEAGTKSEHSFTERVFDECPKCNGDGWIDMDNDHGEVCGVCGGKGGE